MRPQLVLSERVDGVAVISFNRPERHNALNDALVDQWRVALGSAIDDSDVHCVLLRGEGKSFSSGRDTRELGRRPKGISDIDFVRRAQDARLLTLDAPKPIVAAVQGAALGGGLEIALSADMRIAAADAFFGFPEISFGLVADTGGTQLLSPLIGPARAKYLLISGARIDAQQALAWGLVDWTVSPEDLDDAALDLCRQLAAAPPTAAALTKQLVDQAWMPSIRNGLRQELVVQVALFAGEEHRAAKEAELARRAARNGP